MYFVGLIRTDSPRTFINPQSCASVQELYAWVRSFLSAQDFQIDQPVTLEQIEQAVANERPIRVDFEGVNIALLLGSEQVIRQVTDSFVHFT